VKQRPPSPLISYPLQNLDFIGVRPRQASFAPCSFCMPHAWNYRFREEKRGRRTTRRLASKGEPESSSSSSVLVIQAANINSSFE